MSNIALRKVLFPLKKRINANFPYGSIDVAEHFSNILFILLIAHKQDNIILRKLLSLHFQHCNWNLAILKTEIPPDLCFSGLPTWPWGP